MSGLAGAFGGRPARREPVDVLEPRKPDRQLDQLIAVRTHRISTFERARLRARQSWRLERAGLRRAAQDWRDAVEQSQQCWRDARAEFFAMRSTSGDFRRAKAVYERMKRAALELQAAAVRAVEPCRDARRAFFTARDQLREAQRQQEKLTILRDQIKLANQQAED
ncbi:MAG: hypothetical protein V4754_19035 [Pseudomonadota bacterium]